MPTRPAPSKTDVGQGLYVDIRGPIARLREAFEQTPEFAVVATAFILIAMWMLPALAVPLFVLGWLCVRWSDPRVRWPLFVPLSDARARFPKSGQKLDSPRDDFDRVNVRTGAPYARGIFFVGNVASKTAMSPQIWKTDSAARQHVSIFGTSGSGKTEALLGYLTNALAWGSGCSFMDGKGTTEFFYKAYATAFRFGRTEDVLVLNLMTGSADLAVKTPERVSNTASIYALGPAAFLTELTVAMMPDSGSDGIWKDRAIALGSAVIGLCTFDRDKKGQPFSPGKLRQALNLKNIIRRAKDKDLPPVVAASINSYLSSLPGFDQKKGVDQDQKTLEQHGFLEMQFTKILGTLADVYGHVFNRLLGEVHMRDVVLNNRILVFLLPSLEKSGHESRSLGNLGMALNRAAMAALMGFKIEGTAAKNIETLPTRATYPYPIIYDELGYYMPKDGTAIQAAQARGLGLMVVVAAQDRTKLDQQSREETDAIIGTVRTKHFLAVENAPTFDIAKNEAGESDVAVKGGYRRDRGVIDSLSSQDDVRIERRARLTVNEIRAQRSGQGTMLFEDQVIPVEYFYPNVGIKALSNVTVNQFLEVLPPDPKELVTRTREYREQKQKFIQGLKELANSRPEKSALLEDLCEALRLSANSVRSPIEQVFASLALLQMPPPTAQDDVQSDATTTIASTGSGGEQNDVTAPEVESIDAIVGFAEYKSDEVDDSNSNDEGGQYEGLTINTDTDSEAALATRAHTALLGKVSARAMLKREDRRPSGLEETTESQILASLEAIGSELPIDKEKLPIAAAVTVGAIADQMVSGARDDLEALEASIFEQLEKVAKGE